MVGTPVKRGIAVALGLGLAVQASMLAVPAQAITQTAASSATSAQPLRTQVLTAYPQPTPNFDIRIVPGSTIQLVSKSSKLPISIRNGYSAEIRVQVHVAPANLRALVPAVIEVTVPANTTFTAQVPITAIADGEVPLKAWLTTFSGLPLGDQVDINLNVNAEIEGSLISGFVLIVAGLGIAGVLRTRAKRRAARSQEA